jgi:ATP-dependent RNA helicase DDX5/DBP2
MNALDLLSDDDDSAVEEAEVNTTDGAADAADEPEAKRAKLDFAALQRSGYSVGPSAEEEAAEAASSFRRACEVTEEALKEPAEESIPAPAAEAFNEGGAEMSCEKPPDKTTITDPTEADVPEPWKTWEDVAEHFPHRLMQPLLKAGFKAPTDIQAHGWPIMMARRDLVGVAKTGSGKTLAFLLPCFAQLLNKPVAVPLAKSAEGVQTEELTEDFRQNEDKYSPDVLVLAPSRELASQIELEARKFQESAGIRTAACYGGSVRAVQLSALRSRPQCIVATPGRLNDYLASEQQWMSVEKTKFLILDEADKMLDEGFEPQIRGVCGTADSPERQGMLFSATLGEHVSILATWVLRNPVEVRVGLGDALKANADIDQRVQFCKSDADKTGCLKSVLRAQFPNGIPQKPKGSKGEGKGDPEKTKAEKHKAEREAKKKEAKGINSRSDKVLIFCAEKSVCDDLSRAVWSSLRMPSEVMHAGKTQKEREVSLRNFRFGEPPILFATSVAGRGLDVKGVSLVVNYDAPDDGEDYVHRIGRTGRAGQKGTAIALLSVIKDGHAMEYIEQVMVKTGIHVPAELSKHLNLRRARNGRPS